MDLFFNGALEVGGSQRIDLQQPYVPPRGHNSQPVARNFDFFAVPSSQPGAEAPEFGPVSEGDSFEQELVHPSLRRETAAGPSSSAPPRGRQASGKSKATTTRKQWEKWEVIVLLELKKKESEDAAMYAGREQIENADAKWAAIATEMAAKGINRDAAQISNKYLKVLGKYKKIKDYHVKRTGAAPYSELDPQQRKEAGLDPDFPAEYTALLYTFYGRRPCMNPPYAAESLNIRSQGNSPSNDDSPTTPQQGRPSTPMPSTASDSNGPDRDSVRELGARGNSGKRRKKDASKSANAVADAMDKQGSTLLTEHMIATREIEVKQHGEMVDVFKTMATAFMLMAQTK
ncbi:hypothetical protein R1sor_022093 [Riccia sorocarpa]|uniref:Myb/SANT-like DNA-binding domain-containing protein n=1 Tax=Riccia sorocarpa TaxID=122646 RepID=A0ABD3GKU2_9MARC